MLLCFGTKHQWHLIKFRPRTCLVRISKWLVTLGFKRDMNPRWTPRAWTSPRPRPWPRPLLALNHLGEHGLPVHLLKPRYWSRQLYGSDEPRSFSPDAKRYLLCLDVKPTGCDKTLLKSMCCLFTNKGFKQKLKICHTEQNRKENIFSLNHNDT